MDKKRFSVFPMLWGTQPAEWQEIIALAQQAEALGYYSFTIPHVPILPYADERPPDGWIWKHIPPAFKDYQYDALVLLPMIAQATKTIRIGFNVVVTPWLHPFVWAKYMATLDVITGGRLIAGFGLGHAPPKGPTKALVNIGIDGTKRGKMSDEALEYIVQLWTSDELVCFDGKFYQGKDLAIAPKPVQDPYPEIWWAGNTEISVKRAAKYGGMLEATSPSLANVQEVLAPAMAKANDTYQCEARLGAMFHGWVGEHLSAEARQDRFFGWQGERLDAVAAGTPEQCAETIRAYDKAGMEHFVIDFHRHGLDPVSVVSEQMQQWAEEVMPLC